MKAYTTVTHDIMAKLYDRSRADTKHKSMTQADCSGRKTQIQGRGHTRTPEQVVWICLIWASESCLRETLIVCNSGIATATSHRSVESLMFCGP